MNKIYLCAGNKGGTGKSMVATALIDAFLQRGVEPLLIETDDANPDVFKAHSERVQCAALSLDEADGWIEMVNSLDKTRGVPVVVNTAARNSTGVARYGQTLKSTLGELGRTMVTLWVINRQRDSLELLADYLDAMPEEQTIKCMWCVTGTSVALKSSSSTTVVSSSNASKKGAASRWTFPTSPTEWRIRWQPSV